MFKQFTLPKAILFACLNLGLVTTLPQAIAAPNTSATITFSSILEQERQWAGLQSK